MRLRLLAPVMLSGQHRSEGEVVAVDEAVAASLFDRGLVDLVDDEPEAGSALANADDSSPVQAASTVVSTRKRR